MTGNDQVPPELVGREVSVRAIAPPWEGARAKGVSEEALLRGTGCTFEQMHDTRGRISWASFARFLANVGEHLTDQEIIAIGDAVLDKPALRALLLPGRFLFSLFDVYRWGSGPNGPATQTFTVQTADVIDLGNGRLRIEARMKDGYPNAREHWLITKGMLAGIGPVFGAGTVRTRMVELPDGADYDLQIPPKKRLGLGALRRGASWMFAARETATVLHDANAELLDQYRELEREVEARTLAEGELRQLNEQLEKRVAERTAELEAANEELAAANRELSMFSTSAAHDLRSPLRAINGFATALLDDHADALDESAKSQLQRVVDGAIRMAALIDALLALSRVTRVELRRERVDLGELAHQILDRLHAAEPTRIVERVIDREHGRLETDGDPALLRSLLENLLGNAWKFTRDRERARIELTRVDIATFRVRDNGVGFDSAKETNAARIFEPFFRIHSDRDFDGTGIGLATALRIVRRHGGNIVAEAQPNEGASFTFSLTPDHVTKLPSVVPSHLEL